VSSTPSAVVLIPVKSFSLAKVRLAGALDATQRAALARAMAERVIAAADPLPAWCVCDDDDVAAWATAHGARVEWTPGLGLNGAVQEALARRRSAGAARAVIAHGDLPFATELASLADAADDEVLVVPDRRRSGTNVLSLPTSSEFRVTYGPDSFELHRQEAARCGLRWREVTAERLGWDVDEPADLDVPAHLGTLPGGPT
jgi:2-phospho-L-lactate guanylyltransferase